MYFMRLIGPIVMAHTKLKDTFTCVTGQEVLHCDMTNNNEGHPLDISQIDGMASVWPPSLMFLDLHSEKMPAASCHAP